MLRVIQTLASVDAEASGPSYSVPRLCRSLGELGHRVELLTLGAPSVAEAGNVRHERFARDLSWSRQLAKAGASWQMRRALARADADVFHTHGLWMMPNVYPAGISQAKGRPFVLSPRGMLGADALKFSYPAKQVFWALFQGKSARAVTCFHATAHSELEDIRAFGLSQPVAVIPNGIDLPAIVSRPTPEGEGAAPYVLSLGRIHPKKGLDRLVAAFAIVSAEFPDWRLRIIGPDECGCASALQRQAASLGLSRVSVEPPVFGSEKQSILEGAEVFALPTLHENFGMTVAESLAVATPVISTEGAPWAGLGENRCGWWVKHGPEPMAAALREAMSMPAMERREMGRRGREWMERDFAWTAIAEQMAGVYRWLVTGGVRPNCIWD